MAVIPPSAVKPITGYPTELWGHLNENGQLPADCLTSVPGLANGPTVTLCVTAMRSWNAMLSAALKSGHILKAVGRYDSYRPLWVQQSIFDVRYSPDPIVGQPRKRCGNQYFWLRKQPNGNNYAAAACPGTSNHGLGLAVDIGEESDGDSGVESIDQVTANWLVDNAFTYGFAAELVSEPWHWRYTTGDKIPAATLAFEQQEDDMDANQAAQLQAVYSIAFALAGGKDVAAGYPDKDGLLDLTGFYRRVAEEVAKLPPPTVTVDVDEEAIADAVVAKIDIPTAQDVANATADELHRRTAD